MYIEDRVESRTRSILRSAPVNDSTHMDNIEKHS